jgi:hypothetical protein
MRATCDRMHDLSDGGRRRVDSLWRSRVSADSTGRSFDYTTVMINGHSERVTGQSDGKAAAEEQPG